KIQEPAAVRQARAAVASTERQLEGTRKELRSTEQEVESVTAKKQAVHTKLYGGAVSAPRELAALETEEGGLARSLSQLEDRELELMGLAESQEKGLADAQSALEAAIAHWRTEGQEAHQHIEKLEAELAQLKQDREALAATIAPANVAMYERLRARTANRPVARVENNMCQACRVTLPSGDVHRARG